MKVRVRCLTLAALLPFVALARPADAAVARHNVIIFVADGLRASIVDAQTAPEMAAIGSQGVRFANAHSVFPTFTTANASALATGHYLGDTGDFNNTIYAGFRLPRPVNRSRRF